MKMDGVVERALEQAGLGSAAEVDAVAVTVSTTTLFFRKLPWCFSATFLRAETPWASLPSVEVFGSQEGASSMSLFVDFCGLRLSCSPVSLRFAVDVEGFRISGRYCHLFRGRFLFSLAWQADALSTSVRGFVLTFSAALFDWPRRWGPGWRSACVLARRRLRPSPLSTESESSWGESLDGLFNNFS